MRIAIFGTVGAGKTTLIAYLKKHLPPSYLVVDEPLMENPYFEKSYSPKPAVAAANAYKMEIFMLAARMKHWQQTQQKADVLYDRGIYDCPVFAHCNHLMEHLNAVDWKVYKDYYEQVLLGKRNGQKPFYDLVVYLKVDDQVALKRLRNRGIPRELKVDPCFWTKLNCLYDQWAQKIAPLTNFLVLDGNSEDPKIYGQQLLEKILLEKAN